MFNVFTIDYVDRTPEWIIPDEVLVLFIIIIIFWIAPISHLYLYEYSFIFQPSKTNI